MVALDVSGWEQLEQIDAYAKAGGVSREQTIRWLVNMATAHPTRESCYEGDGGWSGLPVPDFSAVRPMADDGSVRADQLDVKGAGPFSDP